MLVQGRWEILGLCHLPQCYAFSMQRFKACDSWCEGFSLHSALCTSGHLCLFHLPLEIYCFVGEVWEGTQECSLKQGGTLEAGMRGLFNAGESMLCPAVQAPVPQRLDGEGMA